MNRYKEIRKKQVRAHERSREDVDATVLEPARLVFDFSEQQAAGDNHFKKEMCYFKKRNVTTSKKEICSGFEAGSYSRLRDFCITQL